MLVQAPGGRHFEVRRRWLPWHPKQREIDSSEAMQIVNGAEDPVSFVVLLLLGAFLAVFGGFILAVALLVSEFLLLFLLLIPLLVVGRVLWILPWVVEVRSGGRTVGTLDVRGWRESEEAIRVLAAAYQRGENPFSAAG